MCSSTCRKMSPGHFKYSSLFPLHLQLSQHGFLFYKGHYFPCRVRLKKTNLPHFLLLAMEIINQTPCKVPYKGLLAQDPFQVIDNDMYINSLCIHIPVYNKGSNMGLVVIFSADMLNVLHIIVSKVNNNLIIYCEEQVPSTIFCQLTGSYHFN